MCSKMIHVAPRMVQMLEAPNSNVSVGNLLAVDFPDELLVLKSINVLPCANAIAFRKSVWVNWTVFDGWLDHKLECPWRANVE